MTDGELLKHIEEIIERQIAPLSIPFFPPASEEKQAHLIELVNELRRDYKELRLKTELGFTEQERQIDKIRHDVSAIKDDVKWMKEIVLVQLDMQKEKESKAKK